MDETYILNVLNGDVLAFRYLIRKYKNSAFNLSRSIVHSDLDAEEAAQDAFVQAYRNLSKFKGTATFSTWFYRIVVNESLKKIKKKKLQYIPIDEITIDDTIPDLRTEPVEHLHEEEQKEMINAILEKLKETEALLLKLYYLEDKRIEEISEITGLTQPNCKVILFRARKSFARMYEKKVNQESRV